ncbi:uncharacterized protein BDZ99DRAFT_285257 [Mytilinidion resinicola]|uniref:DNA2/NAM7 helicase-like C-terminal domain-containing protein n=1 Tax=Mytilinidion resinicola TaxID=574789 RepID=A0A6A6YVR7_9PEZI|nr:uncharacterized protein BDZ99DRAFT_285257 [Mytilinidion resinicola]KAF2812007.1 hypothetical protein BDZ99DRAFT_285257 [Mytilinidion resinicola]
MGREPMWQREFFPNVSSRAQVEDFGTNFTNPDQQGVVCDMIVRLLATSGINAENIGVICMNSAAAKKLRNELREALPNGTALPQVSSFDAFIGQERDIMIVCTVASFELSVTRLHPFGFIREPERLNVAVTRAKRFSFYVADISLWRSQKEILGKREIKDSKEDDQCDPM